MTISPTFRKVYGASFIISHLRICNVAGITFTPLLGNCGVSKNEQHIYRLEEREQGMSEKPVSVDEDVEGAKAIEKR